MSVKTCAAAAAVLVSFALPAAAAVDGDAALKIAKENSCTKCHAVDKAKKGPAYQKIAAKFKGKSDAEAKLSDFLTKSPKVKLEDGSEEEHTALKAKDQPQLKNLVQWILSQ